MIDRSVVPSVLAVLTVAGCEEPPRPAPPAPSAPAPIAASAPRDVRAPAPAGAPAATGKEVVSHTVRPAERPFSEDLLGKLTVAEGFSVTAWALSISSLVL